MDNWPDVSRSETRLSRKPHKCCECGGTILYREVYHVFTGLWDGRWATFKTCNDCQEMRKEIDAEIEYTEERPAFGCLYEEIDAYSNYKPFLIRYIEILDMRGVHVKPWLRQMLKEAK